MEFRHLIFLDIENINFWIYMYMILVGQALLFLLGVCWGEGEGVLNLLCQKRRMSCTWELNMLLLLWFKSCGEEEQHVG